MLRLGLHRGGRRFRLAADRGGVTAIEFALIAATFFMLLLLVVQFGLYYLQVTMLDLAVQKASRNLLINQSLTQAQFSNAVYNASLGVLAAENLHVAVQSATSFGAITPVANISGNGTFPFNPGTYGNAVLVQVGFTGNVIANLLLPYVPGVSSTIAFQREPNPQ